jgi:hypothetical protein
VSATLIGMSVCHSLSLLLSLLWMIVLFTLISNAAIDHQTGAG